MRKLYWVVAAGFLLTAAGARAQDASSPAVFTTQVKPILDAHCARCHEGDNHRGGLSMDSRASLLKGGHHGPAIVPGDPSNSLLIKLIRHEGPADNPMPMPPGNRPKLSDADIATVAEWIKAGAVMPDVPPSAAATPAAASH